MHNSNKDKDHWECLFCKSLICLTLPTDDPGYLFLDIVSFQLPDQTVMFLGLLHTFFHIHLAPSLPLFYEVGNRLLTSSNSSASHLWRLIPAAGLRFLFGFPFGTEIAIKQALSIKGHIKHFLSFFNCNLLHLGSDSLSVTMVIVSEKT